MVFGGLVYRLWFLIVFYCVLWFLLVFDGFGAFWWWWSPGAPLYQLILLVASGSDALVCFLMVFGGFV